MRGINPARLLTALLATATAFVSAEETSASLSRPVGNDCCREGYYCCGSTCQSNHLKGKIACTLQVNGCCDNPNPYPHPRPHPRPRPRPLPWPKPDKPDKCCRPGYFCCGDKCEKESDRHRILCLKSKKGCCSSGTKPWPRPHPQPQPKPDKCCRRGTFCCGGSCMPLYKQPFVKCARVPGSCCKPKPLPKPWPFPKPVDPTDEHKKCCGQKGHVCCNGRCYRPGTQLRQLCITKDCGCPKPHPKPWPKPHPKPWPPINPKEKCCAQKDRVCCDGNCHPPNTRFVRQCDDTQDCGCPNDKPKPWPKPHPKPHPKPPGDCCGRNKVCCGFKCISKWRARFAKCAKIAGGCCRRKEEKKQKKRLRRKHKKNNA